MTSSLERFETLIERHHDEIYGYVWRLLDTATRSDGAVDAQDVTQEVFLRAYKTFGHLRPDSNYRAWLYKIATNCAYTALKRSRRRMGYSAPLSDDDAELVADAAESPHQIAAFNETMAAIQHSIATLPAKQQAAVVLRHIQGLDYDEIALVLGCSEDSARANVYQAIRRLRRELADVQEQMGIAVMAGARNEQ